MSKKILLFTPAAFNMAETTRMIEIAKGIRNSKGASQAFEIQFISDGGDMEHLIEEEGFPLKRMKPRLTPEKIEHIGKRATNGQLRSPKLRVQAKAMVWQLLALEL